MTKQQEKRFSVINHPFRRIFILIDDFIIIYHCHTYLIYELFWYYGQES